jgi:dihydrolipoamide dehydrogenase
MLIYPADVISTINEAEKLGVKAHVRALDFSNIMARMHALVEHDSSHQAAAVKATPEITWFKERGEFISDYTMQLGAQTIKAKVIYIASGARTAIPLIKGIQNVNYLTSDTVLQLQTQPKSIIIVGGGYIGMEYGHFFSAIGTKTTIVQRPDRILPEEEPEVSDLLKSQLDKRMEIYTGYEAAEVKGADGLITLIARNRVDGSQREFTAEAFMIATGRVSNADLLKPERTGVKIDDHGFIAVNEYLENANSVSICSIAPTRQFQMYRRKRQWSQ